MMSSTINITACIITYNEEDRIAQCIRSVLFCSEIIVVDSHSTDKTCSIAADMGARVITNDWCGYGQQKQFAVSHATNDWVLCLDADEHLSAYLADEIQDVYASGFNGAVGYTMPRLTKYMGAWIRHGTWYPDRVLRLFNKQHGSWNAASVHESVVLSEKPLSLRGDLLHEGYRSSEEHLQKLEVYTTLMAQELHKNNRTSSSIALVVRPIVSFFTAYIIRAGFVDGWRGLTLACMNARYTFRKYRKLQMLNRGKNIQ